MPACVSDVYKTLTAILGTLIYCKLYMVSEEEYEAVWKAASLTLKERERLHENRDPRLSLTRP